MIAIMLVTLGVVGAAVAVLLRRRVARDRVNAWWRDRAYFEPTFRQVTAALDQVVWLTTPDKRQTLYISPAYERVFGRSCASLYATHYSFLETVHPDDRARVAAALPQQRAGTWDEHYRIVRPDGAVRWIRSRAFPIRNEAGAVWRIAGIAEDVTERREAEAALARSVSVLRATLEAVGDGLVAVDHEGAIECYNEPFARMLDLPAASHEAHDGRAAAARLDALVMRPAGWSFARVACSPDGAPARPEVVEFRDGRVFDVTWHARRIGARLAGRVWSFHEVTELHRSRQQLRDLALRLEAVREDERTGIAREIHDELGQALTGLRIDLAWIGQNLPRGPHGLRSRIRSMVARLDETVDSVQRISSELRPSVLDDIGLAAAIEWQAEDFEQRTGIQCRLDLNGRPEIDRSRATAVFRILQEALTNVARHAAARRIEITFRVVRREIALTVRDDGRGITAAEAASPQALGLVGMRERALAWDGALEVRGEPGRGTTVTLRLPLERSATGSRVA